MVVANGASRGRDSGLRTGGCLVHDMPAIGVGVSRTRHSGVGEELAELGFASFLARAG